MGGARRDLTLSYVWARGTADLNDYDQFYGNFRNPIVRANEHGPSTADVPHRAPGPRHDRPALAAGLGAGPRSAVRVSRGPR